MVHRVVRFDDVDIKTAAGTLVHAETTSPPAQAKAAILGFLHDLAQHRPPLTIRDMVGLTVLRLAFDFLPPGKPSRKRSGIAIVMALALTRAVAPGHVRDSGFVMRVFLPSEPDFAGAVAMAALAEWSAWRKEALDPLRPPTDDRRSIIRRIALRKCYPKITGERAAARRALAMLDAHCRRRGWAGPNLEPEDIINEMYTLRGGEVLAKGLIRNTPKHGWVYDVRAMRDLVRKRHFERLDSPTGTVEEVAEVDSAIDELAAAELRELLSKQCDSIDARIIEMAEESDAEIGRRLGVTAPAVGKRRKKLEERARRLTDRVG